MANFWKLKLMYDDYNTLAGYPGNKIVFQFYYAVDNKPGLYAYAMKGNHTDFEPPISLQYDAEDDPQTNFVLGNLEAKVSELKKLIKDSTQPGSNFNYLLFSPKKNTDNHIYYEITVIPSVIASLKSLSLNPSPPKPAY